MKSILMLVAASLIFVGATIAVAIPNPVHAVPPHEWCQNVHNGLCFKNKAGCRKTREGTEFGCFKNKLR